jgi:hypothetical protein
MFSAPAFFNESNCLSRFCPILEPLAYPRMAIIPPDKVSVIYYTTLLGRFINEKEYIEDENPRVLE